MKIITCYLSTMLVVVTASVVFPSCKRDKAFINESSQKVMEANIPITDNKVNTNEAISRIFNAGYIKSIADNRRKCDSKIILDITGETGFLHSNAPQKEFEIDGPTLMRLPERDGFVLIATTKELVVKRYINCMKKIADRYFVGVSVLVSDIYLIIIVPRGDQIGYLVDALNVCSVRKN